MSNYAKQQEYRLIKHLKKIPGVKIIEHYGSRKLKAGDVLCSYQRRKFRFDHKSTTNPDFIRLEYAWLYKLAGENFAWTDKDGYAISAITFSLKNKPQIYCFASRRIDDITYTYVAGAKMSYRVTREQLALSIQPGLGISIDNEGYIYTLEDFLDNA